jgi:hypothetical protein
MKRHYLRGSDIGLGELVSQDMEFYRSCPWMSFYENYIPKDDNISWHTLEDVVLQSHLLKL